MAQPGSYDPFRREFAIGILLQPFRAHLKVRSDDGRRSTGPAAALCCKDLDSTAVVLSVVPVLPMDQVRDP